MKQTKGFFAALGMAVVSVTASAEMPVIDPNAIIQKYGKPDRVTSTEYDRPRPPLVTKMIEYKKENVRFTLLANALVGAPPPYKSWKLIGFQDPRDNKVISVEEVEKRLVNRIKK